MIFQHHTAIITPAAAVYGRTGYIIFYYPICSVFINAGMSDCPASNPSGTEMNKYADAGTSSPRNTSPLNLCCLFLLSGACIHACHATHDWPIKLVPVIKT